MPEVYAELRASIRSLSSITGICRILSSRSKKASCMLQTRNGKRTATAAVRIAVEMAHEGLIDKQTAVMRVDPNQIDQLLHPMIDPKAKYEALAKGLASPGAAVGRLVFTAHEAEEGKQRREGHSCPTETSQKMGVWMLLKVSSPRAGHDTHAAVVAEVWVSAALPVSVLPKSMKQRRL